MTDDLMKQALDAFRKKDFDGARALLEQVIEENPGDRTALSNLATLLFLQKETGRAEELFRRVLALEANHLHAAFGLAKLLISNQDFAGSLAELQKVNGAVTPAMRPEFYKLIGIIYVGSEDWETAVNFFEKYRREAPDLLDPLLCLYKARRRAGDDESATAVLETITEKFPDNLEAQVEFLKRVAEGGDFHRLKAALEKALGAHPDNLSLSNLAVHLCLGARHYAYAMIFAGRALSEAGDFDRQAFKALADLEALR